MKLISSLLLGSALISSFVLQQTSARSSSEPQETYWGPGDQPKEADESIRPFKIQFSKEMVSDLKQRLGNTRKLQPSLPNVHWTYGVNSEFVPTLVDYWMNKYDFEKREEHLNLYPQYLTNIQGLDIHFYHIKPELPKDRKIDVLPLLIVHGWPGSVVEMQKVMPLLTTPRADQDFVFELVSPSIPGMGYSSPSAKVGLDSLEIALVFKNLMKRLGHEKFYVQGGDMGAIITSYMAGLYPDNVLGLHSNMCFTFNPFTWFKVFGSSLIPSLFPKLSSLTSMIENVKSEAEGFGYLYLQATRPDTIGVAMSDSPAGLGAYLLEKFSAGTNPTYINSDDGRLTDKFTMDELIDDLMLYWVPNKAPTSFRLYKEFASTKYLKHRLNLVPIKVPSACAMFPNEPVTMPEKFLGDRYQNLVSVTHPPRGGHFAAMEEPVLLTDDIFAAVDKMRKNKTTSSRFHLPKLFG